MRVLVTGATSLIGRHAVAQLRQRGDHVTTLQRHAADLGDHDISGSIIDTAAVARACAQADAVLHLAAKVGVVGRRSEYVHVNVDGTAAVVRAARDAGVQRFVHVSSPSVAHSGSALVGAGVGPADPEHTRGHYATTKAIAERDALASSSADMPIVAIRPHLVWGPNDTQLVGRIVERARQGRLALVGSGAALIDTTYVDNAAAALIAAIDRAPDLGGRAFVVSNGEPRTVHELVTRIARAAGIESSPHHLPTPVAYAIGAVAERLWARRDDDPPMTTFLAEQLATAHWFDQRETRAALQWAPTVSLDEGFERLTRSFAAD